MEAIKPRGSGSGQARVRRDYEARATVAGGGVSTVAPAVS